MAVPLENTLISASSLKSTATSGYINDLVLSHIQTINLALTSANQQNKNFVIYNLPSTISIPNIDKKSAQILLYGNLIKILKTGDYQAKVCLKKDGCFIKITWNRAVNTDVTELKELIKDNVYYDAP